jgi:hypothetical protein
MIKVIALDLEGTLISNAMSQIPRPGLKDFLELCHSITQRTVIYTTVKEEKFREIARCLINEGHAPDWFSSAEYINWQGNTKDLKFISDANLNSTVLIDDCEIYIEPSQKHNWVNIKQFEPPYSSNDKALISIGNILKEKNSSS